MKTKAFLMIAMLVCLVTRADDLSAPGKLNGFLGMPWGTSPEAADKVMTGRKDCSLNSGASNSNTHFYVGGTIADYQVEFVRLDFSANGLQRALVKFKSPDRAFGDGPEYSDLLKILQAKYNDPDVHSDYAAKWSMGFECICLEDIYYNVDASGTQQPPYVRLIYANMRLEDELNFERDHSDEDVAPTPVRHSGDSGL